VKLGTVKNQFYPFHTFISTVFIILPSFPISNFGGGNDSAGDKRCIALYDKKKYFHIKEQLKT
jgi:hypothetical protein